MKPTKHTIPAQRREIGKHYGCGGTIYYYTTTSAGIRICDKCSANSMRGPSPVTEEEHEREEG